jgi:hypothetical protein
MSECSWASKTGILMLNHQEIMALSAIFEQATHENADGDAADPVFNEVAANSVNPFAEAQILDEVYTTLSRKGFIQCSGSENEHGNEILEFVCITPDGYEALKTTKGIH